MSAAEGEAAEAVGKRTSTTMAAGVRLTAVVLGLAAGMTAHSQIRKSGYRTMLPIRQQRAIGAAPFRADSVA
jgi:uncharacterized protein HemX